MSISSVNVSTLLQQMQQSLFSSLDKNADGVLSQSEFQSIGQNVPGSANTAASSASTSTSTVQATSLAVSAQSFSNEILKSLLSLQSDSSALTSFDPASAASSLEQSYGTDGSMTQSQFESAFQSLSGDSAQGSGQVGHHHRHGPPPPDGGDPTQQADAAFKAADSDGDGKLSTSELTSYLTSQQQAAEQGVAQYQAASSLISGFMSDLLAALKDGSTTTASTTAATAVTA
jgi:Ca2+-binding EF-hand superfamily protein